MASRDSGVISRTPLGLARARDLTPWDISPCQGYTGMSVCLQRSSMRPSWSLIRALRGATYSRSNPPVPRCLQHGRHQWKKCGLGLAPCGGSGNDEVPLTAQQDGYGPSPEPRATPPSPCPRPSAARAPRACRRPLTECCYSLKDSSSSSSISPASADGSESPSGSRDPTRSRQSTPGFCSKIASMFTNSLTVFLGVRK